MLGPFNFISLNLLIYKRVSMKINKDWPLSGTLMSSHVRLIVEIMYKRPAFKNFFKADYILNLACFAVQNCLFII